MNKERIIQLAIITAAYNRSWCNDTNFGEMYDDFDGIAQEATMTLEDVGITHPVSHSDIAGTFWDDSLEELIEEFDTN